jgi:glycerate 2-kinase
VARIPGISTTFLLAPDSFKGTFSAREVAAALGEGVERAGFMADLCPVADGGEGTLEALAAALGADIHHAEVSDPLGRPVQGEFGQSGETAIVETASASGLGLISESERDPVAASTYGTGELIMAAVVAGARTVYIGVGGSATTDGGAGAIRAIRDGGGLGGAKLIVLCDVRTPFEDAARVFAPQKGAGADQVRALTKRLGQIARQLRRDPRGVPMSGAAGGLSGGLWGAFGAELVSGAAYVLDAARFDERMRGARAVITGEGKLDSQSLAGKAVSEVATRARQSGVPCFAVAGTVGLDSFGQRILDLQSVIEAGTLAALRDAGERLAASMKI